MKQIWEEIISGTSDYLKKYNFNQTVIGLSGGIDSSLVALISTAVVGQKNTLGVMMPSPYSSKGSVNDAVHLSKNLGIKTLKMPIRPLMDSFNSALAEAFNGYQEDTTEENIQARIRGVLLMALSNKFESILLNTCNKSEDYVGYCTLYGDSCGGIAPIGELYKTDVYRLAYWINEQPDLPDIPDTILTKAPSAELRPGQKDQDDLPPYEKIDPILKLYVDKKLSEDEIIKKGYDKKLVNKIISLAINSEFKRRQSPPPIPIQK